MKNKNVVLIISIFLLIIAVATGIYLRSKDYVSVDSNNIDVSNRVVNDEFLSSLSEKELIHYKIMNSIDFFDSALGVYESKNIMTNEKWITYYTVDVKNRKSYKRTKDIGRDLEEEIVVKDNSKIEINNNEKTYREFQLDTQLRDEVIKLLKPKERFFEEKGYVIKNNDKYPKDQGYVMRSDGEFLVGISESLFNQSDYPTFNLKNYENWNIDGVNKYLGRECIKISGKYGFIDKSGAVKFTALVDKSTGILLKVEGMDNDNKVLNILETKDIKLNSKIDPKLFEKDLTKYTKVNK